MAAGFAHDLWVAPLLWLPVRSFSMDYNHILAVRTLLVGCTQYMAVFAPHSGVTGGTWLVAHAIWGAGSPWLPVRTSQLGCTQYMALFAHDLWIAVIMWLRSHNAHGLQWSYGSVRTLLMGFSAFRADGFAKFSWGACG